MVRISGVDLPNNKPIAIGLTYIFGIGRASANKILSDTNISPCVRCKDLKNEEITKIRLIIDKNYQTEGSLRRVYFLSVKRLTEIGSAAGRRHRVNLPVRGQRTRTNARTRKGNKKMPIANKKIR